jgi:hypothetical protein
MAPPPTPVPLDINLPGAFPPVPQDIIDRFPDAQQWQDDLTSWYDQVQGGFSDWSTPTSTQLSQQQQVNANFSAQQGDLQAQITTLNQTVISGNAALASQIITISALASSASHISAQSTPPLSPSVNDIWVDTANIAAPITYYWNGSAWTLQTTPIIATAISTEASARATADGFLSGKYTITVTAGNVVTGMNITSSSGGGTNISNVIFQAGSFQIYNGATGSPVFIASGGNVLLAGTLNVSGSASSVYIGTGTYNNSNTPFFVNSSGEFSLGTGLAWNGSTLSINGGGTFSGSLSAASGTFTGTLSAATGSFSGSITSTSGTIGGFTIGSSTITGSQMTLFASAGLEVQSGSSVASFAGTSIGISYSSATAVQMTSSGAAGQIFFYNGGTVAGIDGSATGTTQMIWSGGAQGFGNFSVDASGNINGASLKIGGGSAFTLDSSGNLTFAGTLRFGTYVNSTTPATGYVVFEELNGTPHRMICG